MKKYNRFLICILILCLLSSVIFTGCKKLVSTEQTTVKVEVVDSYHRAGYNTLVWTGKVHTVVRHPAVWRITIEYEDVEYTISGSDTYNKYKERIGDIVNGTLVTRTYDDGSVSYDIVDLE